MTEAVDTIFEEIKDLPSDLHPFVRSILVTKLAANFEIQHDEVNAQSAWKVNSAFAREELKNADQEGVFRRAVLLATLPTHKNPDVEWVYRWLRGNGLAILQEDVMRDKVIHLFDDPQKGAVLTRVLHGFLDTNVNGFTEQNLFEVPEAYSQFVSFLVVTSTYGENMSEVRQKLLDHVVEKWKDPEVCRVMDMFGTISDTKELYEKYKRDKDWIMY